MNDQVVMSPATGELAVAVPLYRHEVQNELTQLDGFTVVLHNGKPLAYALDIDEGKASLFSAELIEKKLIFLGDL